MLNSNQPPLNRAQRRALKKKKFNLAQYLKEHPEAIKITLDEEKIAELEAQEAQSSLTPTPPILESHPSSVKEESSNA